jgi:hypothetical protein
MLADQKAKSDAIKKEQEDHEAALNKEIENKVKAEADKKI